MENTLAMTVLHHIHILIQIVILIAWTINQMSRSDNVINHQRFTDYVKDAL